MLSYLNDVVDILLINCFYDLLCSLGMNWQRGEGGGGMHQNN